MHPDLFPGNFPGISSGIFPDRAAALNFAAARAGAEQFQFVCNSRSINMLAVLTDCLRHCSDFRMCTAFITEGGLESILETLALLQEHRIPGKILTTDYLYFSEPRALDRLARFSNLELKLYLTSGQKAGFHPKGYIFCQDRHGQEPFPGLQEQYREWQAEAQHGQHYHIIIGSPILLPVPSSLTRNGISKSMLLRTAG